MTILRPTPEQWRLSALFACVTAGLAAVVLSATLRLPMRVVYNPSDSVPRGWYRRFAMLDDGIGFRLVPWNPVLEQRVGCKVTAILRGTTTT